MPKSYYHHGKFAIPFINIVCVGPSSSTKHELTIYTPNNSFGITNDSSKDFLTQYTAWLDSQSTPQL